MFQKLAISLQTCFATLYFLILIVANVVLFTEMDRLPYLCQGLVTHTKNMQVEAVQSWAASSNGESMCNLSIVIHNQGEWQIMGFKLIKFNTTLVSLHHECDKKETLPSIIGVAEPTREDAQTHLTWNIVSQVIFLTTETFFLKVSNVVAGCALLWFAVHLA